MRCFILKELKKKKYHFLDSNVPIMLEDLQKKVIELPKSKHLEEVGHDPKYYHYHRILSQLVKKCFILKELMMNLAKQGKTHSNLDELVESNHATITFGSFDPF